MWTLEYVLSQVCVVIAMVCLAISYLIKNKKLILVLTCLNAIFFALNYVFLGAYTGTIINLIALIRGVWFFINEKHGKKGDYLSLCVCTFVLIICSIFTYSQWVDILAVFASILFGYGVWQNRLKVYRWIAVINSTCFIVFNVFQQSIFGVTCEVILLICEIVGIIKLYTAKKLTTDAGVSFS